MTVHLPRLPSSFDPLIAEAKRRARQRRILVAATAVLVVAGGAVGTVIALTPTAVNTGPLPPRAALVGSETSSLTQPTGPIGVFAPRFGILITLGNGSTEPVTLQRVRAVLGTSTGPPVAVGQIGARFRLWKPPSRCVSPTGTPCTEIPPSAPRPIAAEAPTPLRLAPGHAAVAQLNFRLLACSRRQGQDVVSLQQITAVYRLPNGTLIQQHPLVMLGYTYPLRVRNPRSLPRNQLVPAPVGRITTKACHR